MTTRMQSSRPRNLCRTHLAYDQKHRHVSDKGVPYEFKDAQQLMNDLFADVNRVLSEVKKR